MLVIVIIIPFVSLMYVIFVTTYSILFYFFRLIRHLSRGSNTCSRTDVKCTSGEGSHQLQTKEAKLKLVNELGGSTTTHKPKAEEERVMVRLKNLSIYPTSIPAQPPTHFLS